MRSFFYGCMGLAVLVMTLSIVAAGLTNSSRSADFRPVWASIKWVIAWAQNAEELSRQQEENPAPFLEEAKKAAENVSKTASGELDRMDGLSEQPIDPRSAACPEGSADPSAGEIPELLANRIKNQKPSFPSLLDLQQAVGRPNCVWKEKEITHWRFNVAGGGTLGATATEKSKVKLDFGY